MATDLSSVSNAALLQGLTSAERDTLSTIARKIRLKKSEVIFDLGEEANNIFIVASGVIDLVLPLAVGSGSEEYVTVQEVSSGQTIGWSALSSPARYSLGARAACDASLVAFDRDKLMTVCREDQNLGFDVLRNLLATVGRRANLLHAMWVRELKRNLDST